MFPRSVDWRTQGASRGFALALTGLLPLTIQRTRSNTTLPPHVSVTTSFGDLADCLAAVERLVALQPPPLSSRPLPAASRPRQLSRPQPSLPIPLPSACSIQSPSPSEVTAVTLEDTTFNGAASLSSVVFLPPPEAHLRPSDHHRRKREQNIDHAYHIQLDLVSDPQLYYVVAGTRAGLGPRAGQAAQLAARTGNVLLPRRKVLLAASLTEQGAAREELFSKVRLLGSSGRHSLYGLTAA